MTRLRCFPSGSASSLRCGGSRRFIRPSATPVADSRAAREAGVTIVELRVVITIIVILIGLLVPVVGMVRAKSHERGVRMVVNELVQAVDAYRSEDDLHRYPSENADQSISLKAIPGPGAGLLELLDRKGLWSPSASYKDDQSRLLDAWGSPYYYSLTRPTPTAPANALHDWNWDAALARERAWGRRPSAAGVVGDGPLAFAYIWSLGRSASATDATTWVYTADIK